MNKEQLLNELSIKINTGEISSEEMMNFLNLTSVKKEITQDINIKSSSQFSTTKLLYIIGAIITVLGIVLFTYQIWQDIGSFGRISVTLGLGILITGIGSLLYKNKIHESVGYVFHFIGGMLIPGGAIVTINELSPVGNHLWILTMTFLIISIFYLVLNYINKNTVLTLLTISNSTAFVYLFVRSMVVGYYFESFDIYTYLTMLVGTSYIFLAYLFRNASDDSLIRILNFVGALGVLGAGFTEIFNSLPWQIFYFLLLMVGFTLSIYVKSRSILTISTIALLSYVSYITGKYFANSVGWPMLLVVLGFIFIALGYASIKINKKYITNK